MYINVYIFRRPPQLGILESSCVSHISYLISHNDILTISYSHILYLIARGGEFEGGTCIPTAKPS